MTDEVVFLVCGRPPMRGKADFAASQAALAEVDIDATSEIQEIKVLGDWAYVWTRLSVVMTPKKGGDANRRAGNTLSILQKQAVPGCSRATQTCLGQCRSDRVAENSNAVSFSVQSL